MTTDTAASYYALASTLNAANERLRQATDFGHPHAPAFIRAAIQLIRTAHYPAAANEAMAPRCQRIADDLTHITDTDAIHETNTLLDSLTETAEMAGDAQTRLDITVAAL